MKIGQTVYVDEGLRDGWVKGEVVEIEGDDISVRHYTRGDVMTFPRGVVHDRLVDSRTRSGKSFPATRAGRSPRSRSGKSFPTTRAREKVLRRSSKAASPKKVPKAKKASGRSAMGAELHKVKKADCQSKKVYPELHKGQERNEVQVAKAMGGGHAETRFLEAGIRVLEVALEDKVGERFAFRGVSALHGSSFTQSPLTGHLTNVESRRFIEGLVRRFMIPSLEDLIVVLDVAIFGGSILHWHILNPLSRIEGANAYDFFFNYWINLCMTVLDNRRSSAQLWGLEKLEVIALARIMCLVSTMIKSGMIRLRSELCPRVDRMIGRSISRVSQMAAVVFVLSRVRWCAWCSSHKSSRVIVWKRRSSQQ